MGVLRSIELFTGAGGLALGIKGAGFEHDALVEYNHDACRSLRRNLRLFSSGSCDLFEGDVRRFDYAPYVEKIDLLAAGAPCQPFSIGGKHRAQQDSRNLFPEVFRAARELRPKLILIENVKGLLRSSFAPYVEYIELQLSHPEILPPDPLDPNEWVDHLPRLRKLRRGAVPSGEQLKYSVSKQLYNAADFGVPQKRERAFIVAVREDLGRHWFGAPPTHSREVLLHDQWVTGEYWERHRIRQPQLPQSLRGIVERLRAEGVSSDGKAWLTVRDAISDLPEAGDDSGLGNHVRQRGAKAYPGHTGSPIDEPGKTLKAGVHGVPGGENMLRNQNGTVRYFTVREAARLQTFPDRYVFEGAWGEAMRQIGNAVPVRLARQVGLSLKALLKQPAATPPREVTARIA